MVAPISEPRTLGDVVLSEYGVAHGYCREEYEVTRVLAATVGLEVGRAMDFDAAVAAVQTVTMAAASASGSFTITVKGQTTAAIAWNATVAQINTALDLAVVRGGGTAGDIIFANVGGDSMVSTNTFTWLNTLGNPADLIFDTRLLLTAGATEAAITIATTTAGELATMKMVAATTANSDAILLAPVSLTDLQNASGQELRRPFLVRGPSIVNVDQIFPQVAAGTIADLITALTALGIQCRRQCDITSTGTPSA